MKLQMFTSKLEYSLIKVTAKIVVVQWLIKDVDIKYGDPWLKSQFFCAPR